MHTGNCSGWSNRLNYRIMNELAPDSLKRPLDPNQMGGESAALGGLLAMINNPELELAGGPLPDIPAGHPVASEAAVAQPQPQPRPVAPQASTALKRPVGQCLLFSGRLAAGKDYVAEQAGAKIIGFADPMYAIATFLCGVEVTSTKNKDLPGMRDFLQKVGQWGKHVVKDTYPYSAERVVLVQMIRALGMRNTFGFPDVEWAQFGLDPDLWIKAANKRIAAFREEGTGKRVAITNARFENEIKFFRALPEWDHWHVMCSPETWAERLAKKKLTPQSKEVNDYSEQIAIALDKDVYKKLKQPGSNMLRVIWNDNRPSPSRRLHTLNQFLQEVAIAEAVPEIHTDLEVR